MKLTQSEIIAMLDRVLIELRSINRHFDKILNDM